MPLAVQSARLEVPQLEVTALHACRSLTVSSWSDLVVNAARALVGAMKPLAVQRTRHNVLSALRDSLVACGAACGVGDDHKIAQIGMSQVTDLS